jgi:protease YdgD
MRLRAGLLAVLLCLPASVHAQSGTTMGDSGLRALDSDYEAIGWEAIGRVDTGFSYCTGTLIAPDLVLTAAHCVFDMERGTRVDPERIIFRAGYRNGRAVAARGVAQIAAHPQFQPDRGIGDVNIGHDVALLRLRTSIPTSQINPFLLHSDRIAPGPVSIVSYGKGRSEVQSRQAGCRMTGRDRALFVFDCDVTQGSSGAPVFSHLNGRGRILSVISAVAAYNGRDVALGMDVAPLVEELKAMLRAGNTAAPVARISRVQVGTRPASASTSAVTVRVPGAKSVRVPGN